MNEFIAEVLGTMLLVLLGNGVVANVVLKETKGYQSGWVVISLGWGFAVMTGVVVAGPISGAHLNPAVTLGLAMGGLFPWSKVGLYFAGEMTGAILGAFLVYLAYYEHYQAETNGTSIRATFCTEPAIRKFSRNFITEAIGTFVLVFVIFYLSGFEFNTTQIPDIKVGLGSIGALPVALLVVSIGLSLGGPTGYAINPARDLGPRIMHTLLPIKHKDTSDWGYAWIPVIAPLTGAAIAAGLYILLS